MVLYVYKNVTDVVPYPKHVSLHPITNDINFDTVCVHIFPLQINHK
jgi:hypothetical protein